MLLGVLHFSQEHFKTISYTKFGEQTECIMGNSKIVNAFKKFWFWQNRPYVRPCEHSFMLVDVKWDSY